MCWDINIKCIDNNSHTIGMCAFSHDIPDLYYKTLPLDKLF